MTITMRNTSGHRGSVRATGSGMRHATLSFVDATSGNATTKMRASRPSCRMPCGIWIQAALLLSFAARLHSAVLLTLRLVAEDTPAGGTVQVKIYATEPRQITSGAL